MKKCGKNACDWCGVIFRKGTPHVDYSDGTSYHHRCLKNVGGRTDLGRESLIQGSMSNPKKPRLY